MNGNQELLKKALIGWGSKVAIGSTVMDVARQSPTRSARVSFAVPDDVVKDLKGRKGRAGKALIVYIPGEVLEEMESPIVRPGVRA